MSNARELAQIPSTPSGRRNLIINGAMNVAQRGTSISITNTTGYTLDRFNIGRGSAYNFDVDVSQSTDAPTEIANSLKIDVQATATPAAGVNATLEQFIESQNTTHLNYGSSSGKYITASFWVKSNKTGTYGFQLDHYTKDRNFVSSYTINSANTWEKKTIIVNPDTTGAAFDDDNQAGLRIIWHLSTGPDDIISGNRDWTTDNLFRSVTGQVNLFDSTSNEFYITGVQLEVGTVATEFEHRSYGEELALCQRYYYQWLNDTSSDGHGLHVIGMYTSTRGFWGLSPPVAMRASPSITKVGTVTLRTPSLSANGTVNSWSVYTNDKESNRLSIDTTITGGTANVYRNITFSNLTGGYKLEAEL